MSSVSSLESELHSKPNGDGGDGDVTLFSEVASLLGDGSQLLSPSSSVPLTLAHGNSPKRSERSNKLRTYNIAYSEHRRIVHNRDSHSVIDSC